MPVQDPGTIVVTCDECDKETEMDTTEYAGDPPSWGVDPTTLEQNGWTLEGSETFCPECSEKREEDGG